MLIIYFGKMYFYVQFILILLKFIHVYLNKLGSIACQLAHK